MIRKSFPFAFVIAVVIALIIVPAATAAAALQSSTPPKGLKVFISVDMEGVCGVVNWDDVTVGGNDYPLFRKLMTLETNAAIEGALAAGATEIVVRDAHDTGRNILPDLLRPEARLLRDWSYGPLSMMEGIDKTFDAVLFVGYHARASTPNAVLKHTMSTKLLDVIVNGKKMPEAGINGLMAGYFGVPVALVTGDQAIAAQARELFGDVETAVVKEAIGSAALNLHPSKAQELIKQRAAAALKRARDFKPYKLAAPFTLEVGYADESGAQRAAWIPGAVRKDEHTVAFTAGDLMELMKLFRLSKL